MYVASSYGHAPKLLATFTAIQSLYARVYGMCAMRSQWPSGLRVKTHIQRPAACDLNRGNKAVDLFARIKSQAAVCVFLP
jgi:hypothetical protein